MQTDTTQTRHTPGPYRAVIRANQQGVSFAAVDMPKGARSWTKSTSSGAYDQQDAATAHLFSASPELLAIAQWVALFTEEGDDVAQSTHYVDAAGRIRCKGSTLKVIEDARAAIAKAKGGAA